MIGTYAIVALARIADGAALGIVTFVSLGIHREKKARLGWAARGARLNGLYVRRPGAASQARARQKDLLALR